jgi:tRNA modification GTPase
VIVSPDDPIYALATPAAPSAIAVIRVSGGGSLAMLFPLLRGRSDPGAMKGSTLRRFTIWDAEEKLDDVMVAVYRAPRSYTGEDGAEIFCHGSMPVIQRVLSLLGRAGLRAAGPGEFTQRAFLNGRMDLTRAEAVNEIVRARTDRARALALDRLGGAIESRVSAARAALVDLKASLELMIDAPDDEPDGQAAAVNSASLDAAMELLSGLAGTFRHGRIYQEGAAVAIAGATNAGKSCLFNALLRQDRAIVSEVHGTTRDWLEGALSIDGIPVRLFDTAGLRVSQDPLEGEGMRRTLDLVRGADALIYLVDGTVGLGQADEEFLGAWESPVPLLKTWNKSDLPGRRPVPAGFLAVSALTGEGLDALSSAVAAALLGGPAPGAGEPLIDSERQRDLLQRALTALSRFRDARSRGITADLLAVDLTDALDALGELTGEVTSAEVLDRMFSRFCVGK